MKRVVDVVVSVLGLIVLSPFFIITALLLLATQGRPLLFTQLRSGLNGESFRLYKFRSMTNERDAKGDLLPDEDRITPVGWWLRRTRFDELLQLYHIFIGDMSLIGPRPVLPETVRSFGELGVRRGLVRPGLTGWAQVNGSAALEHGDKMALDVWYVDNQNLWIDLVIVFKTVGVVLFGDHLNHRNIERAKRHAAKYVDPSAMEPTSAA